MKFSVVLLNARAPHGLQVFLAPVQLEVSGNGIHQALVALEDFQGTGNAAHGKEGGVSCPKGGVRISQSLPVREASCAGDAQGVVGRSADRDSVRDSTLIKAQCLAHASRHSISPLCRVIESLRSHRGYI